MSIDQTNRLRECFELIERLALALNEVGVYDRGEHEEATALVKHANDYIANQRDADKRLFENFRARAESQGYRLVPKAETNLWTLVVRFAPEEDPKRLITFIRDNGYQVVDAKSV